jgi:hypothetical protein
MVTISPEAHALALAAIDVPLDADSRRLSSRIRTEINDPSVQLLLAELVVRLARIEERLTATTSAAEAHELQHA